MRKRRSKRKITARPKKKTRPRPKRGAPVPRRLWASRQKARPRFSFRKSRILDKSGQHRRRGGQPRRRVARHRAGRPRYTLNNGFEFVYELRDLILKSSPAEKNRLIERIGKLGRIKLAVIAGVFMNRENPDPSIADLFIVGDDIDSRRLRTFLKSLEAEVGKEIKFAVMDKEEFQYRLGMFDRFIRVLLEGPHEKIINKLSL